MSKKFKVAVVGCGNRGLTYASEMFAKGDVYEIVALCDTNPKQLEKMKNVLPLKNVSEFNHPDEFFKEKRADIVIIASSDREHVPQALKALDLGYDILLEKPISDSREELRALVDAQKKYGGKIVVCHVLRYAPGFVKCEELLKSGVIGKLYAIDANENVVYWHWVQAYVRGPFANIELSHPAILAKCCHDLDILTSYADSECEAISSVGELGFFKPENAPEGAADRCFECKHKDVCPYSAKRIYIDAWHEKGEPEFAWPFNKVSLAKPMTEENLIEGIKTNDFGRCAFKQRVDVVDHQMVQMTFKNGIKATLKMVFAAERGRRITLYGTYGEIVLDERMDEIHVMPFGKEKQIIKISDLIEVDSGHGGGDAKIIDSLYEMLVSAEDGKTSLAKSVESHLMGIAAEESRKSGGVPVRVHEQG